MATFSKLMLSGSINGASTLITATSSPGTMIHTSVSGSASFDEIWLYADSSSSATTKLTVEFGGTLEKDQIELNIPGESGLILVVPGLLLQNSLVVRAFAAVSNIVSITGYVNRVT